MALRLPGPEKHVCMCTEEACRAVSHSTRTPGGVSTPLSSAPLISKTASLSQDIPHLVETGQGNLKNEEHFSSVLRDISAGFGAWHSACRAVGPHQTHGQVAPAGQPVQTGYSLTHRALRVCAHTVGTEYLLFLANRVLTREQALLSTVMSRSV